MSQAGWQFWIDRGGTFTDVIGRTPQGDLKVCKLLSENPDHYEDAAAEGIRRLRTQQPQAPLDSVKMGTTVATNALLEKTGERTALVITKGFADALRIGYQNRPDLFKLNIELPELLYNKVIEADERIGANGEIITELDESQLASELQQAHAEGFTSCAIVFMHGYRYHQHELSAAKLAQAAGFAQISVSHQVSPLMKLVGRGDTTVVDAYLTPVLRHYINRFVERVGEGHLQFMQSNGGLTHAEAFHGKDAVLSGPAGGVVAMVETALQAGIERVIGLDMGGTSTDVALYDGEYERTFDTQVAGVRLQAPMMKIHTVAAGGGSRLGHDGFDTGLRLSVGPASAGANPGPACYRNGGPLTVTDINVLLGKLQPDCFPAIFGPQQKQSLDADTVKANFEQLSHTLFDLQSQQGTRLKSAKLALGYLQIAVEHMANAIKHISVQKGIDPADFTLACFGGAGPQHACLVADALGMEKIFIHSLGSVLSAYGMGLAQVRTIELQSLEIKLNNASLPDINNAQAQLQDKASQELTDQGFKPQQISLLTRLQLKYQGTDTTLSVKLDSPDCQQIRKDFEQQHSKLYGFVSEDTAIIVEAIEVEGCGRTEELAQSSDNASLTKVAASAPEQRQVFFATEKAPEGEWLPTGFYQRSALSPGNTVTGPAIIVDSETTIVIEPQWQLQITADDNLMLSRLAKHQEKANISTAVNPIRLELFNNLFMFIAEQMGLALRNTASSVNIKERLDFSCALFNHRGDLVANAPHMPVHLGSMGETVCSVANQNKGKIQPGDVYLVNSPYHGGSHLPDLTVISPVFDPAGENICYYVASRGHHADIGGISPGSMPPDSNHIDEEGVLFDNFLLVRGGRFQEQSLREALASHRYPARNIDNNIADLKAQVAANQKGINELLRVCENYGHDVVSAYMDHVLDAAEYAVRQAIGKLESGSFSYAMDNGAEVAVKVDIDGENAKVDFSGTSAQLTSNFNAPFAVCKAAVLYVFRTLVDKNIPLNAGCLRPIELIVPQGSMLNPEYPAAVVAGNVETSQVITDALYGALGVSSGAQGTMNNLTFGNEQYQYYETLCGGTGAGLHGPGCSAVHSHMTNSRLTDPEVLEWRYPVRLIDFAIRKGSGGKGSTYDGGDGVIRQLQFLQPMSAAILANRRQIPPFGLNGAEPGQVGRNSLTRADGQVAELNSCDSCELQTGDTLVIETPGGGGYNSLTGSPPA